MEKGMTKTAKATLAVAAAASATAVCGSIYTGVTGHESPWNDVTGVPWVITTVGVLITVMYALLAVVLVRSAAAIDGGRRPVRVVRTLLVIDLTVLAAVFTTGLARGRYEGPLAAVAGVGFLLAFLLGAVLGALLLRRPQQRTPAVLLLAPAIVIPLTALASMRFPGWADPAYAEAALYLGLALLGAGPQAVPARPLTSAARA
jgi:uncharacterized integral membrane protein